MLSFRDIDPKLCTFCGTCIGICPINALGVAIHKPILVKECNSCGICFRNCPGQNFSFPLMNGRIFGSSDVDKQIGFYKSIYVAHSNNPIHRKDGASGGVVTALLLNLIKSKAVDNVIVVGMDEDSPWQAKVNIGHTEEEIVGAAQSKYTLLPLNAILKEIQRKEGTFALVGLPCHIHGIRKLQYNGWKSISKIKYCIGLFCGFNLHPSATDYLIKKVGVDKKNIKSLEYRGGDWPGGFLVKTKNGEEKFIPKHFYNYVNVMFVPERCLLCPDLTNEFADISAGDAWEEYLDDKKGWSRVIVRTEAGKQIIENALRDKDIYVKESSKDALERSHSHLIQYKKIGFFIRSKLNSKNPSFGLKEPRISLKDKIISVLFYLEVCLARTEIMRFLIGLLPVNFVGVVAQKVRSFLNRVTKTDD